MLYKILSNLFNGLIKEVFNKIVKNKINAKYLSKKALNFDDFIYVAFTPDDFNEIYNLSLNIKNKELKNHINEHMHAASSYQSYNM